MIREILRAPLSSDDLGDALILLFCLIVVILFACGGIQ
jgi:hypothetical protein